MTDYMDYYYDSPDGLRLYARDYPHAAAKASILCMHGLTRNSADFEGIAAHLAPDYRLIVVDQRGRGLSGYDSNPANYQPAVYVQDMFRLLDLLGLDKVILMGTSMGGLISMIMGMQQPDRFAGVILNDIGPVVNPAGLERIKGYVGQAAPVTSWEDAMAQAREINGSAFPDYSEEDWLRFTRVLFREDENGVPVLSYDPAISKPILEVKDDAVPPDLWPVFDALADIPVLVIRGELSDILATDCIAEMRRRKPDLQVAEIPRRGHAPTLDEPACIAAIDGFLSALG